MTLGHLRAVRWSPGVAGRLWRGRWPLPIGGEGNVAKFLGWPLMARGDGSTGNTLASAYIKAEGVGSAAHNTTERVESSRIEREEVRPSRPRKERE